VTARYFDAPGDEVGIAWAYDEVVPAVSGIEGRVAFFNERVDLEVDGVREERPRTPWTSKDWVTSGSQS
jgi:uncharacterized protein (DUF427 family)